MQRIPKSMGAIGFVQIGQARQLEISDGLPVVRISIRSNFLTGAVPPNSPYVLLVEFSEPIDGNPPLPRIVSQNYIPLPSDFQHVLLRIPGARFFLRRLIAGAQSCVDRAGG